MARVYVGGLGGAVQDSDLLNLFSPLGRVTCVEFVRTKGRAFAYVDFSPHSERSLAKLFSTYNGCSWKGGRLRMEKAKEHYLDRLKRERAEDTEPPKILDVPIDPRPSIRTKRDSADAEKLHVFFPKLRKVKAIPFKGTGKHKYSFQRVMFPMTALPVHFCDCEEHSQDSADISREQAAGVDDLQPVVNKREINIMNSVMKKLLEKEDAPSIEVGDALSSDSIGVLDDSEEDEDEENLVMNIGNIDCERVLRNTAPPQEAQVARFPPSRDLETKEKKKDDSELHSQENDSLEVQDQKLEVGVKPKLAQGTSSWMQKSSWKELIGEAGSNNALFSISQILPGVSPSVGISTLSENVGFKSQKAEKRVSPAVVLSPNNAKKGRTSDHGGSQDSGNIRIGGGTASDREPETKPVVPLSFVRSRESEKEWAKAKAALTNYLKRRKSGGQRQSGRE